MLYLTVDDIVPNAIIELNKIDGSREVIIGDAKIYGEELAKHLGKRGYYTLLKLNPSLTESFEVKYGDFFQKYYQNDSYGYKLQENKEIQDIIPIFRESINKEIRDIFDSEEVIENSFKERIATKKEHQIKMKVLKPNNEKR